MTGGLLTVVQKGRKFGKKSKLVLTSGKKTLKSKVRKIERRLAEQRPQPKYFEYYDDTELISAAATPRQLNAIDEGDTDSTRNGEMIRPFHLNIKMTFCPGVVGTGAVVAGPLWQIRVLVFIDRNTTSAAQAIPAVAAVLDLSVITDPVLANKNWDNRHRFKFLYDKRIVVSPFVGTTAVPQVSNTLTDKSVFKTIDISKKLNLNVKYNDATGANLGMNMIYMLTICNVTAAANTNQPLQTFSSRIVYTDA